MGERPRVILVTGFMAAGKTTVAAALAARLACAFVDLDQLITERAGRTPQEIIDEDGEAAFREVETRALREVLGRAAEVKTDERSVSPDARESFSGATRGSSSVVNRPLVVALGGGAWTVERNRALARDARAFTVWLDAPFDLCWQRIAADGARLARPLARERERTRALHASRREIYALASLRVEVGARRSAEEIAGEIASAAGCC